jgi:hypothetical protein
VLVPRHEPHGFLIILDSAIGTKPRRGTRSLSPASSSGESVANQFLPRGAERQKKTSWPVKFELTEQTRQAVPVLGGTASGLDRRSKPFFLFPELWGHGFKDGRGG